jgi:hypothetical protein
MVRTARQESDNEKLDRLINETSAKFGYEVFKAGWARTTWEIRKRDPETRKLVLMSLVESFATTSGEIHIFAKEALPFVEALGKLLEENFQTIHEAVIVEDYGKRR